MSILPTSKVNVQKCWSSSCLSINSATQRCSRCRQAIYCNQECQRADWARHKITCTPYAKSSAHLVTQISTSQSLSHNFSLFREDQAKIVKGNMEIICRLFGFPLRLFNSDIEFANRVAKQINQFSSETLNLLIQYPEGALRLFHSPWGIDLSANQLPGKNLELVLRYSIEAKQLSRNIDFNVVPLVHLVPEKLEFLLKSVIDAPVTSKVLSDLGSERINQASIEDLLEKIRAEAERERNVEVRVETQQLSSILQAESGSKISREEDAEFLLPA